MDLVACSSNEKKQSDWFSVILVAKRLDLIQLPELTVRSLVNARFQLGFRAAHALIAHRLVVRLNLPKWKLALMALETLYCRAALIVHNYPGDMPTDNIQVHWLAPLR